jgi:hypothetical protein
MQKPAPVYSLDLVLHPEHDTTYRHFEDALANPFQPNPGDFPRVNAWWLGEAALLTYWNPVDAIPVFEAAGFQCEFIAAEGTDCYVVAQADFVVAAFRGTQPDDWKDVIADANIVLVPRRTGMVHLGFKQAFDVIRPRLDVIHGLSSGRLASASTPLLDHMPKAYAIWMWNDYHANK